MIKVLYYNIIINNYYYRINFNKRIFILLSVLKPNNCYTIRLSYNHIILYSYIDDSFKPNGNLNPNFNVYIILYII